jgi:hypothetical protein
MSAAIFQVCDNSVSYQTRIKFFDHERMSDETAVLLSVMTLNGTHYVTAFSSSAQLFVTAEVNETGEGSKFRYFDYDSTDYLDQRKAAHRDMMNRIGIAC